MARLGKLLFVLVALGAVALIATACGSHGVTVSQSSADYRGAVLFSTHCSGCHTLSAAGTEGSASSVGNRLRTEGPNLNFRHETVQTVLYAIRNGGFSGAIMPQNIVVGQDAMKVAQFVARYAGTKAKQTASPSTSPPSGY